MNGLDLLMFLRLFASSVGQLDSFVGRIVDASYGVSTVENRSRTVGCLQ